MKRTLTLLLCLLLLCCALFLCACNEGGDETPEAEGCTEHSYEWVTIQEATCAEKGKITETCTVCGETGKSHLIPPATDHPKGEWITDKEPTCTEAGSKHQVCSVCNTIKTKTIPATGHPDGKWIVDINATCTKDGSKHQVCSICNTIETKTISATGHTDGEWIIDVDATCTKNGSKHQVCSVCTETLKTETIPYTGHFSGEWITDKAPTCAEMGSNHQICSVCNATIRTGLLSKIPHTNGEWIIDANATCTENGSKHQVCSVCTETLKTEAIPASHTGGKWIVDIAATCTQNGSKRQLCSACTETIKAEAIPATGHTDGEWIIDVNATCTENGSKHQVCSECADTIKTEPILAMGHTNGRWIVDAYPTCTENGSRHQVCSVCEKTLKTETLYKIQHEYIALYTAPSEGNRGYTTLKCRQECGYSKQENWEDISIDLFYSSNGYGMSQLNVKNVSGGAIIYENGVRVKKNYSISIVNTQIGWKEKSGNIIEKTGSFSTGVYVVNTHCKYNIVVSDGYSTYIFSSDYVYQYPRLIQHIVPHNDNVIRFSVSYDRNDTYNYLYRLRIYAIYGGYGESKKSYTVTVKNLVDNTAQTYSDIEEYVGTVVGNTYSGYSYQKYEIIISDGTCTYVYTTDILNQLPQIK